MRLIDADALLEKYNLSGATKYGNKDAEQQARSYSTMMMYEIADMIEDAQTAYDVDKVVEQLEQRKDYLTKEFVLADKAKCVKDSALDRINEISGIIEIVKGGGVNE